MAQLKFPLSASKCTKSHQGLLCNLPGDETCFPKSPFYASTAHNVYVSTGSAEVVPVLNYVPRHKDFKGEGIGSRPGSSNFRERAGCT